MLVCLLGCDLCNRTDGHVDRWTGQSDHCVDITEVVCLSNQLYMLQNPSLRNSTWEDMKACGGGHSEVFGYANGSIVHLGTVYMCLSICMCARVSIDLYRYLCMYIYIYAM